MTHQVNEQKKIELLQRMFEEGSVSWDQMKKIAGVGDEALEEMITDGLIKADTSYFGAGTHYFPTRKARQYLRDHGVRVFVATPRRAPLKNELHDEALRNLRLKFEEMGYKTWQSERCLRQRGMKEVTPDGILELGRRKIAIELEFSGKTARQYEKRFQFYQHHPAIDAVLYFVATPKLRETLLHLSRDYRKIFVVLLKNFTEHERNAYVERSGFPVAVRLWKVLEVIGRKRLIKADDVRTA